jgi:hypothetical protein
MCKRNFFLGFLILNIILFSSVISVQESLDVSVTDAKKERGETSLK